MLVIGDSVSGCKAQRCRLHRATNALLSTRTAQLQEEVVSWQGVGEGVGLRQRAGQVGREGGKGGGQRAGQVGRLGQVGRAALLSMDPQEALLAVSTT